MPRNPGDTTAHQPLQAPPAPTDEWATEVVSRLPENAHQQARVLHAFERSRQIRSASDLLRGVLAYVYTVHSFEHLSIWSVLVGVADVSATDWRKRLQRASAWLTWLVQEVLAASSSVSPWLVRGGWRRVLLIDGTHVSCPGPLGMLWRVHTGFDLLAGRLTQLKVTDRHEGEHLEVFELQAGDVVVTDRANGLRARIGFVHQQQADVVVRFTPHNLPLEDEQGRAIAVVKWRVWTPCGGRPRGESCGLDHAQGPAHRLTLGRLTLEPAATGGGATAQEADGDQETTASAGRHVVSSRLGEAFDHVAQ